MGGNHNYWYVISDLESSPQGKESRDKGLKDQQQSKKKKARPGKKAKQSTAACPHARQGTTPPSPAQKSKNQQAIQCKFSNLNISKEGGGSIVAGSATKPKVIQVVAGSKNKPAVIDCDVAGISGPCDTHKNKTFSFSEKTEENTSSKLKFNAYSSLTILNFPWKASPIRYHINANTCEKKVRARVDVFPDTELEIEISADFNSDIESSSTSSVKVKGVITPNASISHTEHSYKEEHSIKTKSAVKIKGSFKHDGHEFSIEKNFETLVHQLDRFFELKTSFTKLMTTLGENPAGKIFAYQGHSIQTKKSSSSIQWPTIAMKLNGKWEEEGAVCNYKGELSLGFAPLIKAEIEIDLVEKFFTATPLGVIKKVLDWANLQTFNLMLKIGGEISGNVAVEIEHDNELKYTPKGTIEGELPVSVEAILIKTKGTYLWIIDVETEASITAESGISCKAEGSKSSEVNFEIEFSGIQVFLVAKASLGISSSNKKPPPGEEDETSDEEDEEDKPVEGKYFLFEIDSKKLYERTFDLS